MISDAITVCSLEFLPLNAGPSSSTSIRGWLASPSTGGARVIGDGLGQAVPAPATPAMRNTTAVQVGKRSTRSLDIARSPIERVRMINPKKDNTQSPDFSEGGFFRG